VLSVGVQGLSADVSALLPGAGGKVRGDHDLVHDVVFCSRPAQDGVSVDDAVVTAGLPRLPADVHRVGVVAGADPLRPGAVFSRACRLAITQSGAAVLSFTAPGFTAGETVVVLAELYRRGRGSGRRRFVDAFLTPAAGGVRPGLPKNLRQGQGTCARPP
jgi:stress response protein SCP2